MRMVLQTSGHTLVAGKLVGKLAILLFLSAIPWDSATTRSSMRFSRTVQILKADIVVGHRPYVVSLSC